MIIKSIELADYRNYDSLVLQFDRGTNILYGDNAQGKTNILEAIYVAATTKSHKGSKDREIVNFDKEEAHIRTYLEKDGKEIRVDMHLRKSKSKGIAIDGQKIKKAADLLGFCNVVFFSPEDLGIIKNGPAERRRFVDMELCQLDNFYLYNLNHYNKIVNQRNKLLKDMYMNPDLKGFTAASFTAEAIDTMIQRGERVARANWDKIMALKKQIGLEPDEDAAPHLENRFLETDTLIIGKISIEGVKEKDEKWIQRQIGIKEFSVITMDDLHKAISFLYGTGAFANVNYALNGDQIYDLTLRLKEKPASSLNLGFRFDSEEMASILLNTTLSHRALRGSRLSITGRLNKNPYVLVDYSFGSNMLRKLGVSYMFKYNDINLYDKKDKVDNITFSYHRGDLNLSDIYFRNFKFQLGLRYEYFNYKSVLYNTDYIAENLKSQGFASYYALAHFDTYDKKYFPDKGMSFRADYSLYTDNMVNYDGHAPFSALSADFEPTVRLTRRVYLLPALYGRVLIGRDIAIPYLNYVGGEVAGRYMNQQLPFYGIHNLQVFDNSVVVGRLQLRYRLGMRHYITLTGNYAKQSESFFDILKGDDVWGGGAGYAYNSIIGPISVTFDMSNWDQKLGVYFNLGYYF